MATTTLTCTDDAGIETANETTRIFGYIGMSPGYFRGVIHYPLTIPPSAQISAASLFIYHLSVPRPFADASIGIYEVKELWDAPYVTRTKRTASLNWSGSAFGTSAFATTLLSASLGAAWVEFAFNATGISYLQSVLSGTTTNYGLYVRLVDETDNVLHEFDRVAGTNKTYLSVTYTVASQRARAILFF